MKRLFILLVCLISSYQFALASDDKPIAVAKLPMAAQQFIKTHFKNAKISGATLDNGLFDKEYKAYIAGGTSLEFDSNGEWVSVKCATSAVPSTIIPQAIGDFLTQNHPSATVREIDRDRTGYDVKLSDSMELKFDAEFKFVRYDD